MFCLPNELLQKIFEKAPPKDSYNFALVCKSWTIPALTVLYTLVTVEFELQMKKFSDSITHSPYFGYKVKTLHSKFSSDTLETVFANLLYNQLPNLEVFTTAEPYTYIYIQHALLNSKLKYLKRLQPPNDEIDEIILQVYVNCAFLMKDRLENICIVEKSSLQHETIKSNRLYNELNLFKRLKVIDIQVYTNDEIAVLEHVVEKCRNVKDIEFTFKSLRTENYALPPRNNDITASTMLKYIPITTVKTVKCSIEDPNPHKLVLYIIHKYSQLDKLIIEFENTDSLRLDTSAFTRFFDYIFSIHTFSISGLTLEQNIDGILTLGLRNIKICYTEFSFRSTVFLLDISKEGDKQEASTRLRYDGFLLNFNWEMYMNYMVKGGECIHELRLRFRPNDPSISDDKYITPGNFIPHIFSHCTNLQHLYLKSCILKSISGMNIDTDKKVSLDKLLFQNCLIYDGIFENMSRFIHQIGMLRLSRVEYSSGTINESRNTVISINMPNTGINKIIIDDNLGEFIHVKISTGNGSYYQRFSLEGHNYYNFTSDEEAYNTSINDQRIHVHCRNKPLIKFT